MNAAPPSFRDEIDQGTEAPSPVILLLLSVLTLLAERRGFLGRWVAAGLIVGVLTAVLVPFRYTATTTIMPPQQSSSSASSMLAQLGGMGALAGLSGAGGGGLKSPTDLYMGFLQSDTVEGSIVSRFHLMDEYKVRLASKARKALEEHTTIDGKQKDGLIRLSVTDRSPTRAAELANGYVEQCRRLSESLAVSEASQRRLFLEQQLEQTKNKLASAEEDLKRTEQSTGVIQVEGQARALIETAASLRAQVVSKEVQVQSMRTYAGKGNVDLIEAEQELSGLRAQLAKLGAAETAGSGNGVDVSKGQLTSAGLQYVRKLREVKYQEAIFELLARQFESAKLDEAKEGALLQVVDPARVPDYKSGPSRLLIVTGFLALGFFLGVGYVLAREVLKHLESSPEYNARLLLLRQSLSFRR